MWRRSLRSLEQWVRLLQASMEAAQYESLGRADDALLVKMLQAGLIKLKAGAHSAPGGPL